MIEKLGKFGFLLLAFCTLATFSDAQTAVCNLQFNVFEFNPAKSELTEYLVIDVEADLIDLATNKTITASESNKILLFNNLTAGNYKIEITKNGYQRRVKEFELSCRNVETIETIAKNIYLQKGNSNKATNFRLVKLGTVRIGEKNESDQQSVNVKALSLVTPKYPAAAHAVRAAGTVGVQVTIDEDGEIIEARAVSGHPLLRSAAEKAARDSKFSPTFLQEVPVQITGIINYNFTP